MPVALTQAARLPVPPVPVTQLQLPRGGQGRARVGRLRRRHEGHPRAKETPASRSLHPMCERPRSLRARRLPVPCHSASVASPLQASKSRRPGKTTQAPLGPAGCNCGNAAPSRPGRSGVWRACQQAKDRHGPLSDMPARKGAAGPKQLLFGPGRAYTSGV